MAANAVLLDGTDVPAAAAPSARLATIDRPEEIERGRQVYVAKGHEYREGLRRIG